MEKPRKFQDLMRIPVLFYRTIGEDIYADRSNKPLLKRLLKFYLVMGFLNFNLLVLGECVFFVKALSSFETVSLAIAVAPCIGFSLVSDVKQIALAKHKKAIVALLDELEAMFPVTIADQKAIKLAQHESSMRRVVYIITFLCLAYTTTFSFYPALKGAFRYNLLGLSFERRFGFLIWFPYNATGTDLAYWLTYADVAHAAYLAGIAFLCADLLFIVTVSQLCMHFDYISTRLERYECNPYKSFENITFLHGIIAYHGRCLILCEIVNNIFSTSLLLNFLTASMQICFIAFQFTESTLEGLLIYSVFFLTSMVQVFIVCYYGDKLCTASLLVGDAAYSQNWFQCDQIYNQTLKLLIMRSQKPASIRPPTFPPISFRTYMKVISMSYQFFALLRTTYYRN